MELDTRIAPFNKLVPIRVERSENSQPRVEIGPDRTATKELIKCPTYLFHVAIIWVFIRAVAHGRRGVRHLCRL